MREALAKLVFVAAMLCLALGVTGSLANLGNTFTTSMIAAGAALLISYLTFFARFIEDASLRVRHSEILAALEKIAEEIRHAKG